MKIVVDRIEGSVAVLEVGNEYVNFPVAALPKGAGEGAVLAFTLSGGGELDEATARLNRLKKRDPGGDVFDL